MIVQNNIVKKFPVNNVNIWNEHEYYFNPKKKNYLLVQTHSCNSIGKCVETMVSNIQIYKFDKDNIIYKYESENNLIDKTKHQMKNILLFIMGIIFAKYYYNYKNIVDLKKLKKKYNKLESAYKFILKDKYNL